MPKAPQCQRPSRASTTAKRPLRWALTVVERAWGRTAPSPATGRRQRAIPLAASARAWSFLRGDRRPACRARCGQVPDQHGGIAQPARQTATVGEEGEGLDAPAKTADAVAFAAARRLVDGDLVRRAGRHGKTTAVSGESWSHRRLPLQDELQELALRHIPEIYLARIEATVDKQVLAIR